MRLILLIFMVKFNRIMFHIKVCQEFIKFCFSACVCEEYVVNVSGIEDTDIVNFWVGVGFFKISHINSGI